MPATTNQRTLAYALKQNIQGIELDGNDIVINPEILPENITDFEIIATSTENSSISTTISYHIIKKFNINLKLDNENLEDVLQMTTNTQNTSKNPISLTVLTEFLNQPVDILDGYSVKSELYSNSNCQTLDSRKLVLAETDNNFVLLNASKTELDNPYTYLKVWAELDEYNYQTEAFVLPIKTESVATDITVSHIGESYTQTINHEYREVNSTAKVYRVTENQEIDVTSNASYQIYDSYIGSYGSKFTVNIGRANDLVANKSFVLYSENSSNIQVLDENGNIIEIFDSLDNIEGILSNSFSNGTSFYVKALDKTSQSVLQIVTVGSILQLNKNVAYTMIFNATEGVSEISYANDENSAKIIENVAYIPVINFDNQTKILFDVEGNTESLVLEYSNDILTYDSLKLSKNDDDLFELLVSKSIKTQNSYGDVVITLKAENNFEQKFTLRVFPKVNSVKVDLEGNKAIDVLFDENGSLKSFALAKGDIESFGFVCSYDNRVQNPSYAITYSNIDALSMTANNIYMKSVGEYDLTITLKFVDDDDNSGYLEIQKSIHVTGYLAVRTMKLSAVGEASNKSSFSLYSADTLGEDYIGEIGNVESNYLTKYNYRKMNLIMTLSDGTYFDGQESDSLKISWMISSSNSSLSAEVYDNVAFVRNNNQNIFQISRTSSTVFEVSALKGLNTGYDVFLTVTITQLGKKDIIQSRYYVQKATKIENIGDFVFTDNTTGTTQNIEKTPLKNVDGFENSSSQEKVYFVYRPFVQSIVGAQYNISTKIYPNNVLIKDLDFSVSKLVNGIKRNADSSINLSASNGSVDIEAYQAGTYLLTICSKDSKINGEYATKVEIYLTFADGSSSEKRIRISNVNEFENFMKTSTNKYYKLENDIDISSIDETLLSSINFQGDLDGKSVDREGNEFIATISGIYLEKIYNEVGSQIANSKIGLFASIENGATISNLNLKIYQVNVEYENITDAYFGGLAGINNGTVENVTISFVPYDNGANLTIYDNAQHSYIGGVVGQNNGTIKNVHTDGVLNVLNKNNAINTQRYVGGIAGKNAETGTINSDNTFFNNPNPQGNYTSTMELHIDNSSNTALGGVVGQNDGELTNLSFAGKVYGFDNVGGVAGLSTVEISDCFTEAIVEGQENVGGIVGTTSANLSKCSTVFYSSNCYILGADNVGGLVGKIENAHIELSYVRSYYDATNGDIRLKNSTDQKYLGGLAGCAVNTNIESSYSRAKLFTLNATHYVGGLVGLASKVSVENAFERNVYNVISNSNTKLVFAYVIDNCQTTNFYCAYENVSYAVGSNSNIIKPEAENYLNKNTYTTLPADAWYFMTIIDNDNQLIDYPFLKYDSDTLLTIEKPTEISVHAGTINNVTETEDIFVIWKNSNEFAINDLFDVKMSISGLNISENNIDLLNILQDYYITSNREEVISLSESKTNLIIKQQGEVELTFTSKANLQLSKVIKVFVKNEIELNENNAVSIDNGFTLTINNNHKLQVFADNANDYLIEVKADSYENSIKINGETIGQNGLSITPNSINSIVALSKFENVKLTFSPYFTYHGQKIYSKISREITISSQYGIDNFTLDAYEATISPNSQVELTATVTGANLGANGEISYNITGESQIDYSECLHIASVEQADSTITKVIYKISVSMNYEKVKSLDYFGKKLFVEFVYKLENSENSPYKTQICEFTIEKLSVQNISADFYKHVQKVDGENDNYSVSNVSSNKIIAGSIGVLHANIAPSNAEIDSIVVYHSQYDSYAMNFTQLVKDGERYIDIGAYVKVAKNGFGIEAFKVSNNQNNEYDGNIYIGLVISKLVPQNTEFKVYVEITFNKNQKITKEITLYSEKASELQIIYDFNGQEYNDGNSVFIPLDVEKTLLIKATDFFSKTNTKEEIINTLKIQIGGVATNFKAQIDEILISNNVVLISLPIKISKVGNSYKIKHIDQEFTINNVDKGIAFEAICQRTASGVKETKTNEIKLYPMAFAIKGVNIQFENGDMIDSTLTIKKGIETKLKAKLDCEYAPQNQIEATSQIEILENIINSNSNNWISKKQDNNFVELQTTNEFSIEANNGVAIKGIMVTNEYLIGVYLNLSVSGYNYNISSEYITHQNDGLYVNENNKNINQVVSKTFELKIYRDSADTDAIPVASYTDMKNIEEGNEYRLIPMKLSSDAVIELEDYVPFDLPDNVTFDGNGQTIIIKSFYAGYNGANYGLFTSIGSGSVVKNLIVKYNLSSINVSNSEIQQFTFGGIAAENKGIIYNCKVENQEILTININPDISAYIGGLVGKNTGFISYSTSSISLSANSGFIGGFASINSKKITASKVLVSGKIENSNNQVSESSTLAGFVAKNNGEIDQCYVNGDNTRLKANSILAGFVYENAGTVSNAYVSILIDSGRAGGFVYTNSGTIKSAYTKLDLTTAEQNRDQIAPFVGVNQLSGVVNNTGTIDDCYYFANNFGQSFSGKQIAKELKIESYSKSDFEKFIFATTADAEDGIWKDNSTEMPTLIEPDREIISKYNSYDGYYKKYDDGYHVFYYIVQTIDSSSDDYYKIVGNVNLSFTTLKIYSETTDTEIDESKAYFEYVENEVYKPVDGNSISDVNNYFERTEYFALKKDKYIKTQDISIVENKKYYKYIDGKFNEVELPIASDLSSYFEINTAYDDIFQKLEPEKSASEVWGEPGSFGIKSNPRTITKSADWSEFVVEGNNDDYFVLLSDIELSNTPSTSYNYEFKGKLLGNNMTIKRLYISESDATDIQNIDSMGLFAKISSSLISSSLIKNLNIETSHNVTANDIQNVGILAGSIYNSTIVGINISAENVVVIGKNFVGAVAGVIGSTRIVGANLSASVNAVYAKQGTSININSKLNNYDAEDSNMKVDYSYAGVIAGVITGTSDKKSNVEYVNITGKNIVLSYYTGLAAGLVDKNATIKYVNAKIQENQYIKGYAIAGGLVAENRGTIISSQITLDENSVRNLTFFQGNPMFIGGFVGFNNGGEILKSFSAIDSRIIKMPNVQSAYVVGGLVGIDVGGEINYCYASGSVRGEFIIGGLIGAVTTKAHLFSGILGSNARININNNADAGKIKIESCFAANQWLSISGSIDDSNYISDTRLKGTIIGAFVDKDNSDNGDDDSLYDISKYVYCMNNTYFNTLDSTYSPETKVFTAGKFMKSFGAISGNLSEDRETLNEDIAINICSIGGIAGDFDTSNAKYYNSKNYEKVYNIQEKYDQTNDSDIDLSKTYYRISGYNLVDNPKESDKDKYFIKVEDSQYEPIGQNAFNPSERYYLPVYEEVENPNVNGIIGYYEKVITMRKLAEAFIPSGDSQSLICNANNGDYDIVYGASGVYAGWSNIDFYLPQDVKNGIYPTIKINLNK